MLEALLSFLATFLAKVLVDYVARRRRDADLKDEARAEVIDAINRETAAAEARAAAVPARDRDAAARDLDRGVF